MPVGEAAKEARKSRGLSQDETGVLGLVSGKMVSAMERGERPYATDVLRRLTVNFDYPRLYMEAAEHVTDGVFTTPWLDGECVDLHRASVRAKTCEELQEAIKEVSAADVINAPGCVDEDHRNQILTSILQVLDARVAGDHYIAIVCQEYGFSLRDVCDQHRRKLESRGYIKPRPKEKALVRR